MLPAQWRKSENCSADKGFRCLLPHRTCLEKIMKERDFFGLKIKVTDVLLLSGVLYFTLLALLFSWRVKDWLGIVLANVLAVFIYGAANILAQKSPKRLVKFLLRAGSVQLSFFYLFTIDVRLQHVFFSQWDDQAIIDLEQRLFGGQPTLWMQRFISPWLTEWMVFCYVFYVALYPVLGAVIYYRRGEREMEDYLYYLGLAIVLCTMFSVFFPVAGPMRQIGRLYDVPLRGYFFAAIGEFVRNDIHSAGGAFPSIHCAAATIMGWMAFRYSRVSFYILTPVILSLYISTVYGRFHYLVDVIAGILVAFLSMALGPVLLKAWNQAATKAGRAS
jgi:membrane-associated phospholipid phosphatase